MFKFLNRRISSPLSIGIIAVLGIVVGSAILWFSTRQEVPVEFPEIKKSELKKEEGIILSSLETLKIEDVKGVQDGEVAFLQNGDIWMLSKDLKRKSKTVDTEEIITRFSFSPDGKKIYWLNGKEIWERDSNREIKLLTKASELNIEEIKKRWEGVEWVKPEEIEKLKGGIVNFVLSPDGKYIVYEEIEDYTGCCAGPPNIPLTWIWILKSDGTEKVKIERPSGVWRERIFFDGWLPESKKILFHFQAADEPTQGSPLFEVGIDGRNPKIYTEIFQFFKKGVEVKAEDITPEDIGLFTITVVGAEPVYSPTGEKLAYIKEGSQIRLRDVNTKEVKTILESETIPFGLASNIIKWSEDGNLLTIVATNKIFIFNKDGEIVYESEELVKPEKVKYANYSESGILSPDNKFLGGVYDLLYEKWEKNNIIFLTNLITKERKEFDLTKTLEKYLPAEINIYPQFFSKNGKFYYLIELRVPKIENGKEIYPLITKETFPQLLVIDVGNLNNYKIAENVTQVAIVP